jgi:hypothetical protein
VTLPGSDARSQRTTIPRRPHIISSSTLSDPSLSHSIPTVTRDFARSASPLVVSSLLSASISSQSSKHEHVLDFATHSWDLATGGLKTLTAKRELPMRPERPPLEIVPDMLAPSRGYMLALVLLACLLLMLIGGGLILFVMLL